MNRTPSLWAKKRVGSYLKKCGHSVKLKSYLGGGTDGEVWSTNRDTAIKVLKYENGYYNERDTYLHLRDWGVTNRIAGFWIPAMLAHDDDLMIVEMDIMQDPPYIIDFAKVRLFNPPDFSEETMEDHHAFGVEMFEHNWPRVQELMAALESYQIYYLDPRRGNITFPDMP